MKRWLVAPLSHILNERGVIVPVKASKLANAVKLMGELNKISGLDKWYLCEQGQNYIFAGNVRFRDGRFIAL